MRLAANSGLASSIHALGVFSLLTNRSNNVGNNVVLGTLLGQGLGETDLAELRS